MYNKRNNTNVLRPNNSPNPKETKGHNIQTEKELESTPPLCSSSSQGAPKMVAHMD